MNTNYVKLALPAAALLLAAAACGTNQPTDVTPQTTTTANSSFSVTEPAPVTTATYGTPQNVDGPLGTAEITVQTPELVTYHVADYDQSGTKPGGAYPPMVRTVVSGKGVYGTFKMSSLMDIGWQYEGADGTLTAQSFPPLMTFEKTDPLSNHPGTLGAGQKTAGEVFFQASEAGGKTIVTVGERQWVWTR